MTLTIFGYVFIGGLLPSLLWLYFLLHEDSRCPEPRTMIALAFIVGMLAVPIALPLEQYARITLGGATGMNLVVLSVWAFIEETLKYVMAAAFILWRPAVDEETDYVIYMITVALGFAAAENMLFLIAPISHGSVAMSVFTGDNRFIGSTLLHVVASAVVGFSLAFSDKSRSPVVRIVAGMMGLILATVLHTAFNALIITQGTSTTLIAVFLVWVVAVIFFATFEVLKYFEYRNLPPNTC